MLLETLDTKLLLLLIKLLGVYIVALLLHTFGIYGFSVKTFSKVSPVKFFKKIYKAQLVALSTASSMATLPINMEICEEELGVDDYLIC